MKKSSRPIGESSLLSSISSKELSLDIPPSRPGSGFPRSPRQRVGMQSPRREATFVPEFTGPMTITKMKGSSRGGGGAGGVLGGGDGSSVRRAVTAASAGSPGVQYGEQLTPMDVLRTQGDIGTPYRHQPAVLQTSCSVQAFPLHRRGREPKAQELYSSIREASFFTRPNSQQLSVASLEDDARYWSSPRRGYTFYRHERKTTAAETIERKKRTDEVLTLDCDTSYKAGVARHVAEQTPYAQYGVMRSSVARLPKGGATSIITATSNAVGPGSYEHGIPKSEPFLLQQRPSGFFQSMTPRLQKITQNDPGEPAYASVGMDRAHWKPRFKGAGKFGTGKRSELASRGGTPGPGEHDGKGTSRWPPAYERKSKMQVGGFKADVPRSRAGER